MVGQEDLLWNPEVVCTRRVLFCPSQSTRPNDSGRQWTCVGVLLLGACRLSVEFRGRAALGVVLSGAEASVAERFGVQSRRVQGGRGEESRGRVRERKRDR